MQQHHPPSAPDYREDFFAWTQHQATLLRALAEGRQEFPKNLDVANVAEEIEDLGKAELRAVTSLIRQILAHLIKAASDPQSQAFGHWRTEATNFSLDLPDFYVRSMRQLIDMQVLWWRALKAADVALREQGSALPRDLPVECPYSIDDIVGEGFDFEAALERLRGA